jgi:uncharacterized RDD family membrane protein YckC
MGRGRDVKQNKIKVKEKVIDSIEKETCCDASLIDRFKAFTTDTFMIAMPIMYAVFYFVMGSREEFASHQIMGWVYIFAPHLIVMVTFWYFKSQSPGLKAYELSIVAAHTGGKATFLSLVNRYLFTSIAIMLIIPLFIPYFNKQRRTLQDLMSGTCIKKTPNSITTNTSN